MKIFRETGADTGPARRLRARHLLPLALLALVPILLAPAGSAKPTPTYKYSVCIQDATNSPACGPNANSVFTGDTPATVVRVTVANDSASSTAIQSANINLPDQLNLVSGSGSSSNVTTGTQQVSIHGVRIQPGKSFSATFQVNTACGGEFTWPAQAAYSGDNGSGTPFGPPSSSTGLTTHLNTGCYLAFIAQPTDTELGGKIAAGGASQGGPITVGLYKNGSRMSSCPVGFTSNCNAIVGQVGSNNPPDGTVTNVGGSLTQPLTGSPLLATFSNLAITGAATPEQFRLTATGGGSFAPTVNSGSFLIADDVSSVPCTGGGCQLNNKKLSGSSLVDSFADLTGASGFTFMTLSPYTLGDRVPAGCANRISAGVAGFAESDGRAPGSPLTIRYYVNKDQLKARYGKNVGEQFIPICAGGRPVDQTTHEAIDCTQLDAVGGNSNGWAAQKLTNKGTFAGVEQNAICDADGYYWGILSSYQDKIPTGNPVVSNWGGQNINGANYRFFDIYIPGNWDWRSGP